MRSFRRTIRGASMCPTAAALSSAPEHPRRRSLVTARQRGQPPARDAAPDLEPKVAVLLCRVEPKAAGASSGRFVAAPGRPLRKPARGSQALLLRPDRLQRSCKRPASPRCRSRGKGAVSRIGRRALFRSTEAAGGVSQKSAIGGSRSSWSGLVSGDLIAWLHLSASRSPAAPAQPPRDCCSFVVSEVRARLASWWCPCGSSRKLIAVRQWPDRL